MGGEEIGMGLRRDWMRMGDEMGRGWEMEWGMKWDGKKGWDWE